MNKIQMAHEWAMNTINAGYCNETKLMVKEAWCYADAMQAEADKRNKAEAEKKRKEIREMLNAPNTFIEREGQHFDDLEEWQPDWSQAPEGYDYFCVGRCSKNGYFCHIEPVIYKDHYWFTGENAIEVKNHGYTGNWQDSLRKRPEPKCEVDWRVAPSWAKYWALHEGLAEWFSHKPVESTDGWGCETIDEDVENAPSFGFTGTHIVERPHGF